MVVDDLMRLLEIQISAWLQENFGETLDCVVENGQGSTKHKSKRIMVLTCLYMLDVDPVDIARVLRVHVSTIKSWYKSRDAAITAAALDMYAFVAGRVSDFFEGKLLDARAAHNRLRATAYDNNLAFANPSVSQFDNTADEIFGYYVKRLRNVADNFSRPVQVKQPTGVIYANQ